MDGPPALAERKEKKSLSFPPGQSDEFSSFKAEGRLCFLGAPWNPWSLEPLERLEGTSLELMADEIVSYVFHQKKETIIKRINLWTVYWNLDLFTHM